MIVGAGLAGLIVAHAFPKEHLFEAAPAPREAHKALLRFRSSAVSDLTGIPFRKVLVRKGIWSDGAYRPVDLRLANLYTQKCLGRLAGDRSIWAQESVERYVAPEDFYAQLLDAVGPRISWNCTADFANCTGAVINTAPLPVVTAALGWELPFTAERAPITVARFRVPEADVHQTVYFPDADTPLYRASITGEVLICELAHEGSLVGQGCGWLDGVRDAFALGRAELVSMGTVGQSYGKIASVPDGPRKALIHRLSVERNIHSIGRFATWRNILLDDVVKDIGVVKRLIHASGYDRRLTAL